MTLHAVLGMAYAYACAKELAQEGHRSQGVLLWTPQRMTSIPSAFVAPLHPNHLVATQSLVERRRPWRA